MNLYSNGVPWTYYGGANDIPRKGVAPATFQASPHTILNLLMTPWGEVNTPIACNDGFDIARRFGAETFQAECPYYNYQTVLSEWIGKQGTPQYIARPELPGMAKSNTRVYLELAANTNHVYKRNADGSFETDIDGLPIPTGQYADGFIYRIIVSPNEAGFTLGNGKIRGTSSLRGQLGKRGRRTEDILNNVQTESPISDDYVYDALDRVTKNTIVYPSSLRVVDYVYTGDKVTTMTINHYDTTLTVVYNYNEDGTLDSTDVTTTGAPDADGGYMLDGEGKLVTEETIGTMYPIMDLQGRFLGDLGNLIVTELFAPVATDPIKSRTADIEYSGSMMYRLGHGLKPRDGGIPNRVYGVSSETHTDFCLNPNQLNKSGTEISFDAAYNRVFELGEQMYTGGNIKAPCLTHLYGANIASIQEMFHASELAASLLDADYQCWIDEKNVYSINILKPRDHYGVPYTTLSEAKLAEQPEDGVYAPFEDSFFGMEGGADGDMSNASFNKAVRNYANNVTAMFPIWDKMQYQLGWMYDLGLEVETKKSLYNFMKYNESLIVITATDEFGVEPKNRDDTLATAISLESGYGLFPESSIYKTAPTRGAIAPWSGMIKNNIKWRKPIPSSFSLAKKINDYIGYTTKIWNVSKDLMLERNKGIDEKMINFESLNLDNRTKHWLSQLIIMDTIQHEVVGFTGLQTINDNDSSVLNNLLVAAAVGCAVRAGYEAGVVFAGQTAPVSVIAGRHETRILEECAGIDPSKAIIEVNSYQSSEDYDAGYAITDAITVNGFQAITAVTLELTSQYAEG